MWSIVPPRTPADLCVSCKLASFPGSFDAHFVICLTLLARRSKNWNKLSCFDRVVLVVEGMIKRVGCIYFLFDGGWPCIKIFWLYIRSDGKELKLRSFRGMYFGRQSWGNDQTSWMHLYFVRSGWRMALRWYLLIVRSMGKELNWNLDLFEEWLSLLYITEAGPRISNCRGISSEI